MLSLIGTLDSSHYYLSLIFIIVHTGMLLCKVMQILYNRKIFTLRSHIMLIWKLQYCVALKVHVIMRFGAKSQIYQHCISGNDPSLSFDSEEPSVALLFV